MILGILSLVLSIIVLINTIILVKEKNELLEENLYLYSELSLYQNNYAILEEEMKKEKVNNSNIFDKLNAQKTLTNTYKSNLEEMQIKYSELLNQYKINDKIDNEDSNKEEE